MLSSKNRNKAQCGEILLLIETMNRAESTMIIKRKFTLNLLLFPLVAGDAGAVSGLPAITDCCFEYFRTKGYKVKGDI